jgi:hypothetical protein
MVRFTVSYLRGFLLLDIRYMALKKMCDISFEAIYLVMRGMVGCKRNFWLVYWLYWYKYRLLLGLFLGCKKSLFVVCISNDEARLAGVRYYRLNQVVKPQEEKSISSHRSMVHWCRELLDLD